MGFKSIVPHPCKCQLPATKSDRYTYGTTWECDSCHKLYKLTIDQRENEPYWLEVKHSSVTIQKD